MRSLLRSLAALQHDLPVRRPAREALFGPIGPDDPNLVVTLGRAEAKMRPRVVRTQVTVSGVDQALLCFAARRHADLRPERIAPALLRQHRANREPVPRWSGNIA